MGICSYDGKRLIPAPYLSLTKQYNKTQDGTSVGSVYDISIIGVIVPHKGSPRIDGSFFTGAGYPADETVSTDALLSAVLRKQEGIRQLFATEGLLFEIQSDNGDAPMKFSPRIKSINFSDGNWSTRCDYTISCEADIVLGAAFIGDGEDVNLSLITSASENWQLEFDTQSEGPDLGFSNTYRLTHAVSATGKVHYDAGVLTQPSWQNARDFVLPRLGIDQDRITASGSLNLPDYYTGRNHVRGETVNEFDGTYSVQESWIVSSGNALEDFTVSTKTSAQTGLTSVDIAGSLVGLETRDSNYHITESKWIAASGRFNSIETQLLTRAQAYSGKTLNVKPMNYVVGRNPNTGTISYSVDYDNRRSNIIPGSILETITIADQYPADIFAAIPILGRDPGPILQPIDTISEKSRTLNIEVVMEASGTYTGSISSLQSLFNDARPSNSPATSGIVYNIVQAASPIGLAGITQTFITTNQENWDANNFRFNKTVGWTYQ